MTRPLWRKSLFLCACLMGLPVRCASSPSDPQPVREPAVAGSWYPGDAGALERLIDNLLNAAPSADLKGRLIALVAPHAGYAYSGPTAAAAYRQAQGSKYDAVVILAPSHREYLEGASVYARGCYRTPLGAVPVDEDLADAIISGDKKDIQAGMAGHRTEVGEHSLEIQLPFLQRALPDLKIVPIVIGNHTLKSARRMADAIARAVENRQVLLVASSDLYHGEDYRACVEISGNTLDDVQKLDVKGLARGLDKGRCQACGRGPILIAMMAAKHLGADRARTIARTNSNDVIGKRGGYVVGYGAVALFASGGDADEEARFPKEAKHELLEIARASVEHSAKDEPLPPLDVRCAALNETGAAFVTLKRKGRLRGCIGCLPPGRMPLGLTVQQMAKKAALEDPRFRPVQPEELREIEIEISVLTPLQPLDDVEKIELGRHGLWIRKGYASGVLLPQVPVEQGWDCQTYLERICLKAGLPTDAWKDADTRLWTFEAIVFGEPER